MIALALTMNRNRAEFAREKQAEDDDIRQRAIGAGRGGAWVVREKYVEIIPRHAN